MPNKFANLISTKEVHLNYQITTSINLYNLNIQPFKFMVLDSNTNGASICYVFEDLFYFTL